MKTNYDFAPQESYNNVNVMIYLLLSLLGICIMSLVSFCILNYLFKYNLYITSDNRGDYLAIMGTHCSVVFLTTSLMTMLSEKNKYIYWVEMVTKILISPKDMSFLALVTYSLSTIVGSFAGLVVGNGPIVIGSFLFGIISVTLLFSRMVSIYFQNGKNKKKIEKYLYERLVENDYEKYLIRLKEITYVKAEGREFDDVYENLNLVESCLIKIWKKSPRKEQHIFRPAGFCEEIYMDMISDLSIQFPQEMQDYIDNHAINDVIIKKLDYLVYPILLNSYLGNHRNDLFDRTLCKWSKIAEQKFEVIEYVIKTADTHSLIIADYYSKLFNPFNHEIKLVENLTLYIDALQRLYFESPNIYINVLQYRENRKAIYHTFLDINNISDFPLDILAIVAEGAETNEEQCSFISILETLLSDEIVRHQCGTETEKAFIEKNPLMFEVIKAFTYSRKELDLEFEIGKIIDIILNVDSGVYLNTTEDLGFYNDFEKRALEFALISVKKEIKLENYQHGTSEHSKAICILQTYLEKLNYEGRRILKNEDEKDSYDYIFKKGYFTNSQLAIYVILDGGDKIEILSKKFEYYNTDQYNFETNTILIDGYSCSQNIIMYMLENGLIQTIGRGYQVDGKCYPIAFVNEVWLEQLEELEIQL